MPPLRLHRLMKKRQFARPLFRATASALICTSVIFPADLPVRSVVLYKHGVGFFERSGMLGPSDTVRLDFRADEMNDVLKSLTVVDPGGDVKGLRYDSSIPIDQKLNEFPFQIEKGQPLSAVVDQLKGTRIEMEFGPQKIAGSIVSARLIPGDKDHAEREQLTLLMDSGELRNVDLAAATSIRFTDAKLQLQFRDYLAALTGARSKDKRSVYIESSDTKSREVRASYIVPMPAWKSSYRLLVDSTGQQSSLEGWAVVDNTTGEDWTNIHVSLVSGKPISFITQLYEPRYITRKAAELPEDQAIAPTVHNGAVELLAQDAASAGVAGFQRSEQFAKTRKLQDANSMARGAPSPSVSNSSIRESAAATEIADLFEYSIRQPITVKKNESAMLPFLQEKINVRKLLIYSDQTRANPLNAAEITNNTGKTLDGGPVTVYDAGAYAGEALVETVKALDKRLISYGVDLGTRIGTNLNSRSDGIREIHFRDGVLVTRTASVEKKIYTIKNVDARGKTLILEHPIRSQFTLIDTPKPSETSKDSYRFELKIPASGQVIFPITEENVYESGIGISNITPDSMLTFVQNRKLSDAGRKQLQQVLDLKRKIADLDATKRQIDTAVTGNNSDEQRLRQNIATLSSVSGQQQNVQEYARKLADLETSIAKSRDRMAQLDLQRSSLQDQLNSVIEKLNF